MNSINKSIYAYLLFVAAVSIIYFIGLIIHAPFLILVFTVLFSGYFICRKVFSIKNNKKLGWWATTSIIAAVAVLVNKTFYIAGKYGWWDAWYIWDLHATYMTYPDVWKNLFGNLDNTHPDYPPLLPALLAFFKRLVNADYQWVINYCIHFTFLLLIPVLVYIETYYKSFIISTLALFLFVTNDYFIQDATAQYADTILALFFLCSVINIRNHEYRERGTLLALVFIGLCPLIKNEGLILLFFFLLFHARILFNKQNIKTSLLVLSIPITVLLVFKLFYAPHNDLYSKQGSDTLENIFDKSRYVEIGDYFITNLSEFFNPIKIAFIIYIILLVFRKKWPHYQVAMVLCIMCTYLCIYVVTPYDLQWHLFTSLRRLMHQLMPTAAYLLILGISGDNKYVIQQVTSSKYSHLL